MADTLYTAYTLPNGAIIPNRLVKAAMEENLANGAQQPDSALFSLYQSWAKGGIGLMITGNVMVDHLAMTGPGGVVLEQDTDVVPFTEWAALSKNNDTKVWMQINHPGKQSPKFLSEKLDGSPDVRKWVNVIF